ncbi:MAG TPA: hypothetical protein VF432_14930 [Thermoanaerobaculia bacterium]
MATDRRFDQNVVIYNGDHQSFDPRELPIRHEMSTPVRKITGAFSQWIAVALALLPAALSAEPTPGYTRFLLPVYVSRTPGGYGSLWRSETWLRYSGTETARITPEPFCFAIECTLWGTLEPGESSIPFQRLAGYPESAILVHVESNHASEVTFDTRVRDLSRSTRSAGTRIPVIREDHMSTGPVYLLNIPLEPAFRHTLRMYALPDVQEPEVEVRYFRQPDPSGPRLDLNIHLLRVQRVALRTPPPIEIWNLAPAFAEIGNIETFPELAGESTIWVEIVPLTAGMRTWGMISVTNNETQQVTIISPQN